MRFDGKPDEEMRRSITSLDSPHPSKAARGMIIFRNREC